MNNKMGWSKWSHTTKVLLITSVLLIAAGIGVIIWYFGFYNKSSSTNNTSARSEAVPSTAAPSSNPLLTIIHWVFPPNPPVPVSSTPTDPPSPTPIITVLPSPTPTIISP